MDSARQDPSFKNPPVEEVVVGVRFTPIPALNTAQMGRLWASKWQPEYPLSEEHPPLPPIGPADVSDPEASGRPSGLRLWFLNQDRSSLIQVQQDRLIHNWRKVAGNPYPRYHRTVRRTFETEFGRVRQFLIDEDLGRINAVECEVTYVNHLTGPELETHAGLHNFIAPWSGKHSDDFLPAPNDIALQIRYSIPEEPDGKRGVLTISVLPMFPSSGEKTPIYRLSITAHTVPLKGELETVLQALDQGHKWVVNGFVSVTTTSMHDVWQQENTDG